MKGFALAVLTALVATMAVADAIGDSPNGNVVTVTVTSRKADASAFPIAARVGDQFTITINSNRTTGYEWQLAQNPDIKIVQFILNAYNEPSQPVPGRGGTETWTFRAAGKGKTTIALNYVRPWEKNVAPVKTQKFTVEVR